MMKIRKEEEEENCPCVMLAITKRLRIGGNL